MKKYIILGLLVFITILLTGLNYKNRIKKINAKTDLMVTNSENGRDKQSTYMLERNEHFHISAACLKGIYLSSQLQMDIAKETERITIQREEEQAALSVMQLDDGEIPVLLQLAAAEAGTEDIIGKALVICVVKNRIKSEEFPNTVREVVYQHKNGVYQFSPVKNEVYQHAQVTEECYEALDLVLSGWDESQGAVYFCTPVAAGKWHEQHLTFLFEHGSHRFYKELK